MTTKSKYDRDELIKELKENVTEVRFYKVDGTPRVMKCTLMKNMLPKVYSEQHLDTMHNKPENLNTIVVWDIQEKAWKSFRIENVEYIEALENW